jgi:hypothetical protein
MGKTIVRSERKDNDFGIEMIHVIQHFSGCFLDIWVVTRLVCGYHM